MRIRVTRTKNEDDEAKEKFYKLHEALVINMENEHVLMKKARQLQKELSNELVVGPSIAPSLQNLPRHGHHVSIQLIGPASKQ